MVEKNSVGGHKTQDDIEKLIKEHEAEKIFALKEKLKGLELAHETDSCTIPVTQVLVDDLSGVTMHPWEYLWDHDKINPKTPIILERNKNVIAGPIQYFEAKEKGLKKIDAVYIDSLGGKVVSASNLRKQFKDESICNSFAYSIYAMLFELQYKISYSEFCNNFYRIFNQKDVCFHIYKYILALDEEHGG